MTHDARFSRDIIIRTEALADAARFYETVLGAAVSTRTADLLGFQMGAVTLYVERGPGHGPVLELLVPDVAAARSRLLGAGCVLIEEDPSIPRCYVRDPYGLTFNIGKASREYLPQRTRPAP